MINILINLIPCITVLLLIVSMVMSHLKYRHILEKKDSYLSHLLFSIGACFMGLLVCVLSIRNINESGFTVPIIMGLILMGFLWYRSLLPIISLQKQD
jgi:amino acid transporter